MKALTLEILTDLVEGTLLEANPYHDKKGQFTSKGAAAAYASGAMAAGRAAGLKAKAQGKSKEEIRASISAGIQKHVELGRSRQQGQSKLSIIRGKAERGTIQGQAAKPAPKPEPKPEPAAEPRPTTPAPKPQGNPDGLDGLRLAATIEARRVALASEKNLLKAAEKRLEKGIGGPEFVKQSEAKVMAVERELKGLTQQAKALDLTHPAKGQFARVDEPKPFAGAHKTRTYAVPGHPEHGTIEYSTFAGYQMQHVAASAHLTFSHSSGIQLRKMWTGQQARESGAAYLQRVFGIT